MNSYEGVKIPELYKEMRKRRAEQDDEAPLVDRGEYREVTDHECETLDPITVELLRSVGKDWFVQHEGGRIYIRWPEEQS